MFGHLFLLLIATHRCSILTEKIVFTFFLAIVNPWILIELINPNLKYATIF